MVATKWGRGIKSAEGDWTIDCASLQQQPRSGYRDKANIKSNSLCPILYDKIIAIIHFKYSITILSNFCSPTCTLVCKSRS
jgi:hypothetical protein